MSLPSRVECRYFLFLSKKAVLFGNRIVPHLVLKHRNLEVTEGTTNARA